jgi:DEAD/DEAH box helicase domain-containing protein
VRHPSYFFDASPEHALINPDNLHILLDHIKCAAFELPFAASEQFGREDVQEILGILSEEGFVHRSEGEDGNAQWNWTTESYPADAVSLRSVSSDNFVIVDLTNGPTVIGETDFTSGPATLHEKAIYIVEGKLYQVERLDHDNRKAFVRAVECDYYTDAITYSRVTILDVFQSDVGDMSAEAGCGRRSHGDVHVVSRVVGFKKIKFHTNENIGSGELDLPEQQMHTTAYWLTLPRDMMTALPFGADDRRDGVIGLSFAMRQVAQLMLMCDRQDIGISIGTGEAADSDAIRAGDGTGGRSGSGQRRAADFDEPRVFIYDNYPGGIGFSEPLFGMHDQLLAETRALISSCTCDHGCPTCVGPIGESGPLAKQVALMLLDRLLTPVLRAS